MFNLKNYRHHYEMRWVFTIAACRAVCVLAGIMLTLEVL
jgi:hypothetical protein